MIESENVKANTKEENDDEAQENATTKGFYNFFNKRAKHIFLFLAKKSRIIIRNLVYDIREKHLRTLFSKYGNITDINIPLNPSTNTTKGFAFVQLENKNQSLKAIKVVFINIFFFSYKF